MDCQWPHVVHIPHKDLARCASDGNTVSVFAEDTQGSSLGNSAPGLQEHVTTHRHLPVRLVLISPLAGNEQQVRHTASSLYGSFGLQTPIPADMALQFDSFLMLDATAFFLFHKVQHSDIA